MRWTLSISADPWFGLSWDDVDFMSVLLGGSIHQPLDATPYIVKEIPPHYIYRLIDWLWPAFGTFLLSPTPTSLGQARFSLSLALDDQYLEHQLITLSTDQTPSAQRKHESDL